MRIIILVLVISFSAMSREENKELYTVFYFGATSCAYCNIPENIEAIKKLKFELPLKMNKQIKFVMICMDNNIEEGLKFINKYGYWDEISIGGFYNNELALENLNNAEIPGIPHIMVYKVVLQTTKYNIPTRIEKKLMIDLIGGKQINEWIEKDYPFEKNN